MIPAGNTKSTDVFRNGEKTEVCRFMGQRGKKNKKGNGSVS